MDDIQGVRMLNLPLFSESDESLERPDAWSEPKGFLIGSWNPERPELAQQYVDAANILLDSINRGEQEDYRLAYPALFLFRHSLELMLKAVLDDQRRGHDLGNLTADLESFVKEHYQQSLAKWIPQRLAEIAKIDPSSTSFRYAERYDKNVKSTVPLPGESYVNVRHLQIVMNALNCVLNRLLHLKPSH